MEKTELEEIENYLKQDDLNSQLVFESKVFIQSMDAIKEELEKVGEKVESLNDKLKGFDFLDYFSSKEIHTEDLNLINKIIQDLKIFEGDFYANEEYSKRWKEVWDKIVNLGNEILRNKIESDDLESLYLNDDFATFVVLLEAKEEIMDMVIERRRKSCSHKIRSFMLHNNSVEDKEVFFRMLVNQELFMWSMLFPGDINAILNRQVSLKLPLGFSKFERFIYAIFLVFFQEEGNLKGKMADLHKSLEALSPIHPFPNKDGKGLDFINDYPRMPSHVHDWFYDSLLYKSLREYLNDGVVDL